MNKSQIAHEGRGQTYDEVYAKYYDILNQHKNYKEETERLEELITSLSVCNAVPIIDIGCGTGCHAINLSEMRANPISGFDTSNAMINEAKSKGSSVDFFCGEISHIRSEKYGFAFSLFNVINCIKAFDDLARFFSSLNRILKPGSYFFFEFWNKDLVTASPPTTVIRQFSHGDKEFIRTAEPDNSKLSSGELKLLYNIEIVSCNGEKGRFSRTHDLALHSFNEIEGCLQNKGFQINSHRGSLPELSLSTSNARMTSVLAKKTG